MRSFYGSFYYQCEFPLNQADIEVSERPSVLHAMIGGEWILDTAAAIATKIIAMDDAIKGRLNSKAIEMGFDGINGAIRAAGLPVGEHRQDDGAKLHLWHARTWKKAGEIRDAFLAGQRPEPTWEEVESELPEYPII